jgi:hyperosmotically inducible periplasmic protein
VRAGLRFAAIRGISRFAEMLAADTTAHHLPIRRVIVPSTKGRTMLKYAILAGSCLLSVGCNEATQPTRADITTSKPTTDANNTGVNVRDRGQATKTPLDQNENKTDIEITASIRKRVVDTKLSTDAHNVKIITQDGKVTLRGPVETADEKARIEDLAVAVAGAGHVENQLEVKAAK